LKLFLKFLTSETNTTLVRNTCALLLSLIQDPEFVAKMRFNGELLQDLEDLKKDKDKECSYFVAKILEKIKQ